MWVRKTQAFILPRSSTHGGGSVGQLGSGPQCPGGLRSFHRTDVGGFTGVTWGYERWAARFSCWKDAPC